MTIMKKMYNVIVAMIIMVITAAPVFAGTNVDKNARPDKKEVRMMDRKFDKNKKVDKKFDKKFDRKVDKYRNRHMTVIEVATFKINPKAAKGKNVVAAAKAVYGVKDVKWNPRKGMMTVTYDAKKTTARRIKAAVN